MAATESIGRQYRRRAKAPTSRLRPRSAQPETAGSGHLMLADKDRIFTNLYGLQDPGLEAREEARPVGRHQGHSGARAAKRSSTS